MRRDAASERQIIAANPLSSTWLSANAGSGKTRVLTDRVARLLLDGVDPQRILCLTYTKAAASEMQNRLFSRLGDWAMLDRQRLTLALKELGVDGDISAEVLARSRRLFARAIETPGGLKIQTIHAFCASLLRRFPLEAGVTPQFSELDDRTARILRDEVVEAMATHLAPDAVRDLASHFSAAELSELTAAIAANRTALATEKGRDALMHALGLPAGAGPDTALKAAFRGDEAETLKPAIGLLRACGGVTYKEDAELLEELDLANPDRDALEKLYARFLYRSTDAKAGRVKWGSKAAGYPLRNQTKIRPVLEPVLPALHAFMDRLENAKRIDLALDALPKTEALHRFASVFLAEYAARKSERGALDFDDLILKAGALLTDPSVAQWVLFRLDGGLDHILVDEAQDTSPAQWQVIALLAQEFTAGQGAREDTRTIFVVGDKKQSIYSFQGADIEAFDQMRGHFRARLADVSIRLENVALEHSFRSSPTILRLVDTVFDERRGAGLGGLVTHVAYHDQRPGRVDLWPVIASVEDPQPEDWTDPVDLIPDTHHTARLAWVVARQIRQMIDNGTRIPEKDGSRPVHEGDFLILVQRRSALFHEIIRACKDCDLAIAGSDRLKIGAELAVRDLTALLAFLATPEDDLSLAAALRSPLLGWSENALFRLAAPRSGYLWEALRDKAAEHPETLAILGDLRDQSDFLRPFELIERILTRHDGRRLLLDRLGPEAEEGIDELLNQALSYEANDVPSLTGFLGWFESDDIVVKRQMEGAGRKVRVMTVHGAKGLEAPVVILPDTAERSTRNSDALVTLADGTVVWPVAKDDMPEAMRAARLAEDARAAAERRRLLYVAMTRAESWLIVAAAGKTAKPDCWYNEIATAMEHAGATPASDDIPHGLVAECGPVLRIHDGAWPPPAGCDNPAPALAVDLPAWAVSAAETVAMPSAVLSPSDLGGAKAMPGDTGQSEEEALRRGRQLHLLLEYLPGKAPDVWPDHAVSLLRQAEDGANDAEIGEVLKEATAVLQSPDLAFLFGPDSHAEVSLTADLGGRRMLGAVDRLVFSKDRILIVDFKSNAVIPSRPEETPDGILRQMAAYRAAMRQIAPDRPIEVAVLWTRTALLMQLPDTLLDEALASAGLS
ncbi:MAG: double-strand break repair helicase AddA [Paracoccaceae bacterium]